MTLGSAMRKWMMLHLILAFAVLGGCSATPPDTRQGEIVYLQSDEIRTLMQKMAVMLFNLELIVENPPTDDPLELQNAVVEQLGEIEKVAVKLGAGPKRTNHYLIDSGIDRVVDEIQRAQQAALAEPSDFGPSLDIIQQCKRCHLMR
jgi:hypothetical protein